MDRAHLAPRSDPVLLHAPEVGAAGLRAPCAQQRLRDVCHVSKTGQNQRYFAGIVVRCPACNPHGTTASAKRPRIGDAEGPGELSPPIRISWYRKDTDQHEQAAATR